MIRLTHLHHRVAAAAVAASLAATVGAVDAQAPNGAATAPESPAGLVARGEKLNAAGDQTGALALYDHALQADPHFFDAHVAAGIALDLEGQYDRARQHLNAAIAAAAN